MKPGNHPAPARRIFFSLQDAFGWNAMPADKPTRIQFPDGSTQRYVSESSVEPFDGRCAACCPVDEPLPESLMEFSIEARTACNNLLTIMNHSLREAAFGFLQYAERVFRVAPEFLPKLELIHGRPIEFHGLPYGSWHEAILSACDDVWTILDHSFGRHWRSLGDVTYEEFLGARADVIGERWNEFIMLLNEKLTWDENNLVGAGRSAEFEIKQAQKAQSERIEGRFEEMRTRNLARLNRSQSAQATPDPRGQSADISEEKNVVPITNPEENSLYNAIRRNRQKLLDGEIGWKEFAIQHLEKTSTYTNPKSRAETLLRNLRRKGVTLRNLKADII